MCNSRIYVNIVRSPITTTIIWSLSFYMDNNTWNQPMSLSFILTIYTHFPWRNIMVLCINTMPPWFIMTWMSSYISMTRFVSIWRRRTIYQSHVNLLMKPISSSKAGPRSFYFIFYFPIRNFEKQSCFGFYTFSSLWLFILFLAVHSKEFSGKSFEIG